MTNGCVFISYSSQDVKVAEVIERSLEDAGFEVWRDQSRLQNVADWSQSIAETLAHDVDAVSLVWSRAAAESKFVKNEWLTARALGIPIVPCRLSDAPDLPAPLYNLQCTAIDEGKHQAPGVPERFRSLEPRLYSYEYTVLPRKAYIPFRPNPRFVGRHTDLVALYLKMIGNINTIGITQVGAVGMGGIGKTQLAIEFAYRFGFYFEEGGIFWIQAANPSDWLAQFVAIARDRLELPVSDPHSPDAVREYLNQLQQYFERRKQHVLVIMDNVSDPLQLHDQDALLGVSPLNLGCNLLFTTRRRFEMPGVMSHSVDVLSEIASYELLTHLRQPDTGAEEEAAHQICASLGGLPLAVTLASGYLKNRPGVSFQTYLGILNRDRLEIIDRNKLLPGNLATRHETAVAVTLGQQWNALVEDITSRAVLPDAQAVFRLAGQFPGAQIIPEARLRLLADIPPLTGDDLDDRLEEALGVLSDFMLIERMEEKLRAIRLHPLIREFANRLTPNEQQHSFRLRSAENVRVAYSSFARLNNELRERGVDDLIGDLQIAIEWKGVDAREALDLKLMQSALRLSSTQLLRDRSELAGQLIGRLTGLKKRTIQNLLSQAKAGNHGVWFRPVSRSLTSPAAPLFRTFPGRAAIIGLSYAPDCHRLMAVSADGMVTMRNCDDGYASITLHTRGDDIPHTAAADHVNAAVAVAGGVFHEPYGGYSYSLAVWNLKTGELDRTFGHHIWPIMKICYVGGANVIISGSWDKTVKVWDFKDGRLIREFRQHLGRVNDIAILPDNSTVVSASWDKTLIVWDINTGQASNILRGHTDEITAVGATPDGMLIVSGSRDRTLRVWRVTSRRAVRAMEGHEAAVTAVAVTPDGKRVLSGAEDGSVKLWDIKSGREVAAFRGHVSSVGAIAVSTDGAQAASGATDGTVHVWDLKADAPSYDDQRHLGPVTAISVAGNEAISISEDQSARVWNRRTGALLKTYAGYFEPRAMRDDKGLREMQVTFQPENLALAVRFRESWAVLTAFGEQVTVWDPESSPDNRYCIKPPDHDHELATALYWDDTSNALWTAWGLPRFGSAARTVFLTSWDTASDDLRRWEIPHEFEWTTCLTWLPRQKVVVCGTSLHVSFRAWSGREPSYAIKLIDVDQCKVLAKLEGHSNQVCALAAFNGDSVLVSSAYDRTLRVWDIAKGCEMRRLEGHESVVTKIVPVAGGQYMVTSSYDHSIKLWRIQDWSVVASFTGEGPMLCCAASQDGRTVLAGEASGRIHCLRIETSR